MKRSLALVAFALALLPRPAAASTFLQFTQLAFNDPWVFTPTGPTTTITATSVPVFVVFDPAFCLVAGCGGVTPGVFSLNFSATSTGPASLVNAGADINQNFAGTLSFTSGTTNLLTVLFTDILAGAVNGSTPTMAASEPPDFFSGSSDVFDPLRLGVPRGFALSFSDLSPGLGLAHGPTIRAGAADATGTFNAEPVPEPATLALVALGLALAAALTRRRASAS